MVMIDANLRLPHRLSDINDPASWYADPTGAIEQLPVVNIPLGSLVAAFYLRQAGTDAAHVRLLADAASSVDLPPILVQKNSSRIIDGMHRFRAAKLRGEHSIRARIVDCTDADALVLAVRSNTLHGLPLSKADRVSGAKRILAANPDLSDRCIAGMAGLSPRTIASLRNSATAGRLSPAKRLGRDGKRRPVASEEGRQRAAVYIRSHPEASLRQVARASDISLGTAHSVREKLRTGSAPKTAGPGDREARPAVTALDGAVDRLGPAATTTRQQALEFSWPTISAKLANDPALRYTPGGRAFLRWMSTHSMQADEWREFVDTIPQRWAEDVARVAASMSAEWDQYARSLRTRLVTAC